MVGVVTSVLAASTSVVVVDSATVVEVDVTRISTLRDKVKRDFEAREGVKLSFLPFFCKAAVEALKQYPQVNATIDMAAGTVTYHDGEHLGIAVDTDRLRRAPAVPALDAQGYTLIGGRLLPGDNGAVALFMYENAAAQRLTLYVVRSPKGQQESAFRFSQEGKVGVFSWIDTRCAYALSGELDREALGRIAKLIYLELEGSSPVS